MKVVIVHLYTRDSESACTETRLIVVNTKVMLFVPASTFLSARTDDLQRPFPSRQIWGSCFQLGNVYWP